MSKAFDSANFTTDGIYSPENLICKVHKYPEAMSAELRSIIGTIFSTRLTGISGFRSGYSVDPDITGKLSLTPFECRPAIAVQEVKDRTIAKTILEWVKPMVDAEYSEKAGLDLIIYEPASDYSEVVDAWYLTGVYPGEVGQCEKSRSLDTFQAPVNYEIELLHKSCHYGIAEIKNGVTPMMIAEDAWSELRARYNR